MGVHIYDASLKKEPKDPFASSLAEGKHMWQWGLTRVVMGQHLLPSAWVQHVQRPECVE